jgi:hypothetical protein
MMNNSGNISFPTPGNNTTISMSNNNSNDSTPTIGDQYGTTSVSSSNSISDFIQLPILSLIIILAIIYTILVLIRPAFRKNKLNWFTINLCLMSALLSTDMLALNIKQIMNESGGSIPCRLQGFLLYMTACQVIYSHAVIAVSRLLTIVYASKHFFRSTVCLWSCIGFGWLIAFLIALPYLFIDSFICSSSTQTDFLPYYTLIVTLIAPVIIVLVCNIRIFLFVRQSSRRVHAEGDRGNDVSQTRDVHLLKTMILTFTIFVGGWMPVLLTQTFSQSITISSIANAIFQILLPLSMLCDVILLIYTNQPIRLFLWQSIVKRRRPIQEHKLTNIARTRANTMNKH